MNILPFVIDPIALQLGPVKVTWYGMILGLGAVVGLLLAVREGKRFQIPPDFFMDLLLIGVPSAIIGARTYYVAFEWDKYKGDWYEIIAVWHGGIAIHGALIGAVIAAIIYTRVKKVGFWRIADICAPSLIAGQMIGRWGNFINQEAHGGPVDREFLDGTLHLPDWIINQMQIGDVYYHPTFLYESFWNLCVLLILLVLRRRVWLKAGELFLGYFALYSVGRFFIEGLRTDSLAFHGPGWLESLLAGLWAPMQLLFETGHLPEGGGNVRMAQFISLMLVLAAITLIVVRRVGGFAKERYLDPVVFGKGQASGGDGGNEGGSSDGGQGGSGNDGGDREGNSRKGDVQAAAAEVEGKPVEGKVEGKAEAVESPGSKAGGTAESGPSDAGTPGRPRYEPGNPLL